MQIEVDGDGETIPPLRSADHHAYFRRLPSRAPCLDSILFQDWPADTLQIDQQSGKTDGHLCATSPVGPHIRIKFLRSCSPQTAPGTLVLTRRALRRPGRRLTRRSSNLYRELPVA